MKSIMNTIMNAFEVIMKVIGKIIIYGLLSSFVIGVGFVFYVGHSAKSLRAEICDQAIVGQKLEFKTLIEKYIAQGVDFSFRKINEQTSGLLGKTLTAEDVANLSNMTGSFSFRVSRGFGHHICLIRLKDGTVESTTLTGFD